MTIHSYIQLRFNQSNLLQPLQGAFSFKQLTENLQSLLFTLSGMALI